MYQPPTGVKPVVNNVGGGLDNLIETAPPIEKEKPKVELEDMTSKQSFALFEYCIKDLSNVRIVKNGQSQNEVYICDPDFKMGPNNLGAKFNYSIKELNNIFNTKENDLSDWFQAFFTSNLIKYSNELFDKTFSRYPVFTLTPSQIDEKVILITIN